MKNSSNCSNLPPPPTRIGDSLNTKTTVAFVAFLGIAFLSPQVFSGSCRVAATMCEVQKAIEEAKLAPTPDAGSGATVAVTVTNEATFSPNLNVNARFYRITITPTVYAVITNSENPAPATISCTPIVTFYQYVGTNLSNAVSTAVTTYQTGQALPTLGPLTVSVCTALPCVGTPDNTNFGTSLPSGGIWPTAQVGTNRVYDAYLTGTYQCTYTDPNTGGTVDVIAAIPQTT